MPRTPKPKPRAQERDAMLRAIDRYVGTAKSLTATIMVLEAMRDVYSYRANALPSKPKQRGYAKGASNGY